MRVPATGGKAWLNGRCVDAGEVSIPLDDPAFHAGIGLFETLALHEGRPLDLDPHLERLSESAQRIGLALELLDGLRRTVGAAAAEAADPDGWLKIVVTRGGIQAVFTGRVDRDEVGRSVGAVILPWRRHHRDPLVGLKTLNYAASVLGAEEAARRGAEEGLWLNDRGHLTEGCTSNLFAIRGRKLFTASPSDGILPGVVRALALSAARAAGLSIHEGKLRVERLRGAAEAFLTSSVRGVRPLVRLDGRDIGDGRPGPGTRRLAEDVALLRRDRAAGDKVAGHTPRRRS